MRLLSICSLLVFGASTALPQSANVVLSVTTLAGQSGTRGYIDGTGTAAQFYGPAGLVLDGAGNLFVADSFNCTIRKITPAGVVTLFAGGPFDALAHRIVNGSANGTGTNALFYFASNPSSDGTPFGPPSPSSPPQPGSVTMAIDASGNLYVADTVNSMIRKVTSAGVVTTIAGSPGSLGYLDGAGAGALFYAPIAIAADGSGNLYVADTGTIRKITSAGVVSTLAGKSQTPGSDDGTGSAARFNNVTGLAADNTGNVYVADTGNQTIRKITPAGVVTTFAGVVGKSGSSDGIGTTARFNNPTGLAIDSSGNLYVADTNNSTIRKITPNGVVSTLAGLAGNSGSADGTGNAVRFNAQYGITVDSAGNVYVSDTGNNTIRKGVPVSNATGANLQLLAQPQSVYMNGGQNAVFTVNATGTPAPTYQWQKNGVAIPGATGTSYTNSSPLASDDRSSYSVAVTSGSVTVTSSAATLRIFTSGTVIAPIIIVGQPANQTVTVGQSATFMADVAASPAPTYQWTKNGVNIPGATSTSYIIAAAQTSDAGIYALTITNSADTETTNGATLTVNPGSGATAPAITTQPTSLTVAVGAAASFTVVATGNPTPTYQWKKNGAVITGATAATYTIASAQTGDAATYTVTVTNSVSAITSNAATLTVTTALGIATQPTNQTVSTGAAATFTVVASGTGPFSYQWTKNGIAIGGATSASYTITSAQTSDAGLYAVTVTNSVGSVTSSNATLVVTPPAGSPPAIAVSPVSQYVTPGSSVTFSVVASGSAPLTYQWKSTGTAIAGATNATYTIANVQAGNMGFYSVTVSNSAGSVDSDVAILTVAAGSSRLTALSTRGYVPAGGSLTPGFYLRGSGSKSIIVRGVGPSLSNYGVASPLSDSRMDLIPAGGTTPLLSNDDWGTNANLPALRAAMPFPLVEGSKDAAALATLSTATSSGYTVRIVPSGTATAGIALAEVYDLDATTAPVRFFSLSTLGYTGPGDNILTPGFFVTGDGPKQLLIRAVGPTLSTAPYNVPGALADPQFRVVPLGKDLTVASNDNWGGTAALQAAFTQTNDFALPANSKDAAAIVRLPPGGYTIQATGVGGTTGTVLVEVYDMDP